MWHTVFYIHGKLVEHFPDFRWLQATTRVMKRQVSILTKGWDDSVNDNFLKQMMAKVVAKVCQDNHAWGDWCVARHKLKVYVDASSLTMVVVLERCAILEDVCWLHMTNNVQHINLAELDILINGLNLTLQ